MKERAIVLSGDEVRAVIAGTKTQKRCVVQPKPSDGCTDTGVVEVVRFNLGKESTLRCPYGVPGEHLYVRETWCSADTMYQGHENDVPSCIGYPADKSAILYEAKKPTKVPAWDLAQWDWDALTMRSATTMPRWASRLTLEIISVRIERLQNITEEDAKAEGVDLPETDGPAPTYRAGFALLWIVPNGKRASWASNPWIWALTFRRTT